MRTSRTASSRRSCCRALRSCMVCAGPPSVGCVLPLRLTVHYSAKGMAVQDKQNAVVAHLSHYLDQLFAAADRASERVKDGVANRVADRLADALTRRSAVVVLDAETYEDYRATVETLEDPEAMESLRRAEAESDEDARPYEDIRRELGLA